LGDATAGHGHLFLLSSEPGIGKTRLADEFGRLTNAQGVARGLGRCWDVGGGGTFVVDPIVRVYLADRRQTARCDFGLTATPPVALAHSFPNCERHTQPQDFPDCNPLISNKRVAIVRVATLLKNVARIGR
jgi:hypothetical protein